LGKKQEPKEMNPMEYIIQEPEPPGSGNLPENPAERV
jgi:hypothetical protein